MVLVFYNSYKENIIVNLVTGEYHEIMEILLKFKLLTVSSFPGLKKEEVELLQ